MVSLKNRIIGAALLRAEVYEEVEADKGALGQAAVVVIISSIAAGIGNIARGGFGGVFVGTIVALVGWCIWAYLTYLIGVKILPEPETKSDPGELLRTIGFASAPGIIRILAIIPCLESLVFLGAAIWMLVAMVIAVRQALDYASTLRAVIVCAIGWIVQTLILGSLFYLLGGGSCTI
jgi:hypothetical protein